MNFNQWQTRNKNKKYSGIPEKKLDFLITQFFARSIFFPSIYYNNFRQRKIDYKTIQFTTDFYNYFLMNKYCFDTNYEAQFPVFLKICRTSHFFIYKLM